MDIDMAKKLAAAGIMPRKTITRVKSFTSGWLNNLESYLNEWLEEQGPAFRLVDIKYNCTSIKNGAIYTALVIYTDLEPLEDEEEVET